MTIDQMIEVLQAAKEGKQIQFCSKYEAERDINWNNAKEPTFNFGDYDYRVKPEPREWVFELYDGVVYWPQGHKTPTTCSSYGKRELIKVREVLE